MLGRGACEQAGEIRDICGVRASDYACMPLAANAGMRPRSQPPAAGLGGGRQEALLCAANAGDGGVTDAEDGAARSQHPQVAVDQQAPGLAGRNSAGRLWSRQGFARATQAARGSGKKGPFFPGRVRPRHSKRHEMLVFGRV
jgi:hypothetical protein